MTQGFGQEREDQQQEAQQTGNTSDINPDERDRQAGKLSFWQTMVSVVQASFGVQNSKNKERDFEKGSIKGFIAAALIFTVVFVLTLVVIVNVVLG